jgi:hypothetical protein
MCVVAKSSSTSGLVSESLIHQLVSRMPASFRLLRICTRNSLCLLNVCKHTRAVLHWSRINGILVNFDRDGKKRSFTYGGLNPQTYGQAMNESQTRSLSSWVALYKHKFCSKALKAKFKVFVLNCFSRIIKRSMQTANAQTMEEAAARGSKLSFKKRPRTV